MNCCISVSVGDECSCGSALCLCVCVIIIVCVCVRVLGDCVCVGGKCRMVNWMVGESAFVMAAQNS